ncbi:periplasmic protein [Planctopirus ephydatiae]|uniref:Periplasmic protein n=1 Tax=Planctopirus ephydatiae TaxID=2528019 RepID=A0A518GHZ8_9PLAN|nr:BON domain-containing protein [Planctopirus ephydatiae]QDV28160.1 periplasmic protein [Planctopirus ephydatiae]
MRKYGQWVLTLGLLASIPNVGTAAPWSSKDEPAATKSTSSNQKMAEDVAAALKQARLQGFDIEIACKGGVATLKGKVTDPKQRDKASQVVERVPGVKSVNNELVVVDAKAVAARKGAQAAGPAAAPKQAVTRNEMPPEDFGRGVQQAGGAMNAPRQNIQQVNFEAGVSNQQMAEQIAQSLTSAQLDGYDIEIRYQSGVVTLDGSVPTMAQKVAATRACQATSGVAQVQNNLVCTEERAPAGGAQPVGYPQMAPQMAPQMGRPMAGPGMPPQVYGAAYQGAPQGGPGMGGPGMGAMPGPMGGPAGMPMAMGPGMPGGGAPGAMYNNASMPDHAWPSYAQYPNYAAVTYPQQYSASAFPYIGPFYPYPQVPLGWRKASLEWDDGYWNLKFRSRTDKWWWFLSPNNW